MCKININQKTKTKELGQSKGKEKIVSAKAIFDLALRRRNIYDYSNEKIILVKTLCNGTIGYWGELDKQPSIIQTAKAVQDQYNFSTTNIPYIADLKLWKMEQNINIGLTISSSINTLSEEITLWKRYFNSRDNKTSEKFNFETSVGMNSLHNIKTLGWPFGRVVANIKGTIRASTPSQVRETYFVEGEITFDSDTYSWDEDGDSAFHNAGIGMLGSGYNMLGKSSFSSGIWWYGSNVANFVNTTYEKFMPLHSNCPPIQTIQNNQIKNAKLWREGSRVYLTKDNKTKMPIHYARKFYFYHFGIVGA